MAEKGHEEQFSPPTLSARYVIRQETFAGTDGNARDAPIAAISLAAMEPRVRRSREIWGRAQDCRVSDEAVRRIRPWACRRAYVNSSSSALASFRSCVSKPSVKEPYRGASRSRASSHRPCRARVGRGSWRRAIRSPACLARGRSPRRCGTSPRPSPDRDMATEGTVRKTACWIGGVRRRLRVWLRSPIAGIVFRRSSSTTPCGCTFASP
jgi:hypothetical protein